jgi:hypothetical protein
MNIKQENFGRETLTNIVNNLYNAANLERTKQVIEAETPRVNIPGIGMVTTRQAVDLAQYNPRAQSLLEAWQGEHPGEPIENFLLAQDKPWMEWNAAGRPGTFQQWKRDNRATIQMDPGDRAYKVERAQQRAYFTSPKFLEDVKNDSRLMDFASSPESEGKGEPGSVEYDNAYQEMRIKVVDELVKNAFPESKRAIENGNLVWKDPEMGIVHIWSK